jgi:hypothetical protein
LESSGVARFFDAMEAVTISTPDRNYNFKKTIIIFLPII